MAKLLKKDVWLPLAVGLAWGLLLLLLGRTYPLEWLEWKSYDLRVMFTPAPPTPVPVEIVMIDDQSLRKAPEPFVFWTPYFAGVLDAIHAGGALAIGLDHIHEVNAEEYMRNHLPPSAPVPPMESLMVPALRHGDVVVASFMEDGRWVRPSDPIFYGARPQNVGLVNRVADKDGVIRRSWLQYLGHPALAALLALKLGADLQHFPLDRQNEYLLRFYSPPNGMPSVSFWDVYHMGRHRTPQNLAILRHLFRGKLVFIGPSYKESRDFHPTPFFLAPPPQMPGVEVHANAALTLLSGNPPRRLPYFPQCLLILLLGALAAPLTFGKNPWRGVAVVVGCALIVILMGFVAFARAGIWMDMAVPVLSVVGGGGLGFALRMQMVDQDRQRVKEIFSKCVSGDVARELMKMETNVLAGAMKDMTVLFSDVNGFTSMSERLGPSQTVSILNEYFTLMEAVIFKYHGTINKFVGDELMVLYGVPLASDTHALSACLSAIEMDEVLAAWNQTREDQGLEPVSIKIGINTGPALVGTIGTSRRLEYTAMGDTINQASRIMNKTKEVGGKMLISEATYHLVKAHIAAEYKGEEKLRGKVETVKIYDIVGRTDGIPAGPMVPRRTPESETLEV